MKTQPKTYILMGNRDYEYKPDERTGHFNLGTVLKKPTTPESLLEGYSIINRHSDMPLKTGWAEGYINEIEKHKEGQYGVFANFLASIGSPVGADASYNRKTSNSKAVNIERLETYFMTPTKAYLQEVFDSPAVQAYVQEKRFRNVYIVTGIRVALSGSGSESMERVHGVTLNASVDPGAFTAAPRIATVGPDLQHSNGSKSKTAYDKCSDYVYAYRIMEMHYSLRKSKLTWKEVKGETYSLDESKLGAVKALEVEDKVARDGTAEYDITIEDEWVSVENLDSRDLTVVNVKDADGEMCEVVQLKTLST